MKKGNIDKAAELLGLSQRRIHGLVAEGVLPPPRKGIHNLAKCMVRYEAYRRTTDKAYRIQCEREQMQRDLDAGKPARWTIELAAEEFGVSEKRIRDGLRRIGAL